MDEEDVPKKAPRKGMLGRPSFAVGRRAGLNGGGATLKVAFEKAWNVRTMFGKEGKRMDVYMQASEVSSRIYVSTRGWPKSFGRERKQRASWIS